MVPHDKLEIKNVKKLREFIQRLEVELQAKEKETGSLEDAIA